jgi:amino acid transporter
MFFYRGLKAQGIDRRMLPYRGWWQPYTAIYGFVGTFVMVFVGGYTVFLPIDGIWNVPDFLFSSVSSMDCRVWTLVRLTSLQLHNGLYISHSLPRLEVLA